MNLHEELLKNRIELPSTLDDAEDVITIHDAERIAISYALSLQPETYDLPITDKDLIWQTRDDMPTPTNPLQRLCETLTMTARDCSEDKMIAFMYAIIVGWDDASFRQLQQKHNWSDEDIVLMKRWHESYNKAWNLFMKYNK